jgi:acyl-coenzyme A thioesterase PaaI-like protein
MSGPVLPPYGRFLGILPERDEEGALLFRLPFSGTVVGRPHFLHGGAIAGLLEIAAVGTVLEALKDEGAPRSSRST